MDNTTGDEAASWTIDVRVDEITGLRFVRAPYPFRPHFPGQEVLGVDFLGPGGKGPSTAACTTCMRASGCARRS